MIAPMTCEEIFNNFGKSARVVLYSDAQAVERQLAMKQDDWLKECQENDRLRAALAAAQGEVERLRKLMNIRPVNCDPLRIIGG
jgi:hypothetical protein